MGRETGACKKDSSGATADSTAEGGDENIVLQLLGLAVFAIGAYIVIVILYIVFMVLMVIAATLLVLGMVWGVCLFAGGLLTDLTERWERTSDELSQGQMVVKYLGRGMLLLASGIGAVLELLNSTSDVEPGDQAKDEVK